MVTEATRQVIHSSVDLPGFSVSTASRTPESPRAGSLYNTTTLAAAVPVWFHPGPNGNYIVLFSRRLTSASPSAQAPTGPIFYSSATPDTDPCWMVVNPTGSVISKVVTIPSQTSGARVLTSAASSGEYLFVLNRYQAKEDGPFTSLLQHFRISREQGVTLLAEEEVSDAGTD